MFELYLLGVIVKSVMFFSASSKDAVFNEDYLTAMFRDALQWPVDLYQTIKG